MQSISFTVHGTPTPKGSFTHMPNGAMVAAGTSASRKRMVEWRTDIKYAAVEAMANLSPSHQAIRLSVEFALPYPKSSVRKYQMGWLPHTKKPDIDKLMRALLDGLTHIVWHDDSQVCFATVNKVYAWRDDVGATVHIDFLDDDFLQRLGESRAKLLDAMAQHGIR